MDTSSSLSTSDQPTSFKTKKHITLENCVIKGYHEFKIRPPRTDPVTMLRVDREYTNTHDENACLVWIPALNSFSSDLFEMVTDGKKELTLKDVAGLPVGHVPLGLSYSFRQVMDTEGDIYAEPIGDPIPSFPPWPAPNEVGGGVVIPCHYHIYHSNINNVMSLLSNALIAMPEGEFMRLDQE